MVETLPAHCYRDPELLDRERQAIFGHCWQYLGPAERVMESGQFLSGMCGDVPIVVVRDLKGGLRAFVNVCRHRCAEVVSGHGCAKVLRCPYHGWVYGLDGSLRRAPRSDLEPDFDPVPLGLVPASVAVWGPLVFVHPDADAVAFDQEYPGLSNELPAELDVASLRFHSRSEWQVAANWKVLSENYLECYHCSIAHPAFSKLLQVGPEHYCNQTRGKLMVSTTPVRSELESRMSSLPYDPRGVVDRGFFALLWPNTTINVMPGPAHAYVLGFTPLGPERSVGYKDYFTAPDVDPARFEEMRQYFDHLGQEDRVLVESVQRGLRSGRVPRGRLMPKSESMIQHFQHLVRQAMADEPESPPGAQSKSVVPASEVES